MTRFVIDPPIAARLLREGRRIAPEHQLVAPSTLRADVLALLYLEFAGSPADDAVRQRLDRLSELKVRLLGDRVSRATAWQLASRLGWAEIAGAEYLAVAKLQADAIITGDARLREAAPGITVLAGYDDLF